MSETRLKELLRQRALIAEHLAWLEREIAGLAPTGQPVDPAHVKHADIPAPAGRNRADPEPVASTAPVVPAPEVEALFERFQTEEKGQGQISKQGCWLVFAGIMLLGLIGIATLIFVRYR